jgi:two-component system sensor histidine kinase/response regulator
MRYRVLYVDDDEPNLYVFEAACANDFDVQTATSAELALEIMRKEEVAVLLTDQRMPGTTGVELAAAVREEFPETIRMLVTAYADLDSAIDAINWGQVHRYLRKPWDIRELRTTLNEAAELFWMNREMADLRRRLLETERVYAMGVVAASIGKELTRPIAHLSEALAATRTLTANTAAMLAVADPPIKKARAEMDAADGQVASAQLFAGRVLELLRGMDLPMRERSSELEKVALCDVIRLTLQLLRGEFRTRAQIRLDVKTVPLVLGSSAELGQVVLNLLVNALQSFPPVPCVSKGVPDNLITVRLFARTDSVCLEVEDNGIPIPERNLARLLDPTNRSLATDGSRLGLAISKRIVEELGGRIEAERPAEGGTRLRLILRPAENAKVLDRRDAPRLVSAKG